MIGGFEIKQQIRGNAKSVFICYASNKVLVASIDSDLRCDTCGIGNNCRFSFYFEIIHIQLISNNYGRN